MPYIPLLFPDTEVNKAILMATQPHLEEAHYLLAATRPSGDLSAHFGRAAAIMTVLTIAATSAIRYFDTKQNKKIMPDRKAFVECVLEFFPWNRVTIIDDQHRSDRERQKAAASAIYDVMRNPLVHSGGVTSKTQHRSLKILHPFPGLSSPQENEIAIADYCAADISREILIELEAFCVCVHTRPLYWCTRKMIERFAADPRVQRDIENVLTRR